jgi:hypothetical protein
MIICTLVLEVMDKEPGIVSWCLASFILGLVGLLTCRRFPRAVFILVPIYVFLGWSSTTDMRDPYVGEAIRLESGAKYFVFAYLAVLIVNAAPFVGYFLSQQRGEPKR